MKEFLFPIEVDTILRKKKSLKKQLLESNVFIEKNIAILGGSTTAQVKDILELFLLNDGIKPNFYESDYNQYFEDAVFPPEALTAFKPDIVYLHTSVVNITQFPTMMSTPEEVEQLLQNEMDKFKRIWKALGIHHCSIIQNNFDFPIDRSLGNLDAYDHRGKTNFIQQLNARFAVAAREMKNLYLNDIHYLSANIGLQTWFDRTAWYGYKYALSYQAIPALAKNISAIVGAILGKTKKCLVLDLDNTCWGGVIGDDGVANIKIGKESALAEAHSALQTYAKELKDRGILLAVASKNNEDAARQGFTHPETVLSGSDFAAFKANWEHKHLNIHQIAKELNIGADSLVFLDDNPVERDIVQTNLPQVMVPNIGEDITAYIDHLDRNQFFEVVSFSKDDAQRNEFYLTNQKREQSSQQFEKYEDFLLSLSMTAEIKPFSEEYLERISQLINKTNQFNLTTKRFTFGEVEKRFKDQNSVCLYGKLNDKYGDNGLIAISMGEIVDTTCHVDLWLMSCRVLKRDMEFAMLDTFVEECRRKKVKKLVGYYYPTVKNSMVADLYDKFGFKRVKEDEKGAIFELSIEKYQDKNKAIKVN